MNEEMMSAIFLASCWFTGLGCCLAMYMKVFTYAYKVFVEECKKCVWISIIGMIFSCYVNVIVNKISIEFGMATDFMTVMYMVIKVGFYTIIYLKLFKRNAKLQTVFRVVIFDILLTLFRVGCMRSITEIIEQCFEISSFWLMENIVWSYLFLRLFLILETKIRVVEVAKHEESISNC